MNSRTSFFLFALALWASLALTPSPAHSMDFAEGANLIYTECPGLLKRDWPNATPEESQAICSCMRDAISGWSKDYTTALPNKQQWADLGLRATQQCMTPFARKSTIKRCMANATLRQQFTRGAQISDAQFDRYCDCHVNLAFDEAAKGVNTEDPEAKRAMQAKSFQQCLAPLRAEKSAP